MTSEDVSANYSVPIEQVRRIAEAERGAVADGLRAHGLSGAGFTLVCLRIFVWSQRRHAKAETAETVRTARGPRDRPPRLRGQEGGCQRMRLVP